MSIEQTNQDKYIDSKYISHVSDKNKKEIDEIIANIVQAPYKFLAKCHSCGFYLSFWRGSNIHYGNFFLSESGKVFNVADITMHKENSYSIAIKRDLAVFYASNGGLYKLMRRLNFSKEDISMIEKVGKQTYLSEIKKIANNNTDNFVKKNANAILSSFSNEESLALTSDEKDKVNSDIKTNVNSIKEKTINDLEKHLNKIRINENLKEQWLSHYNNIISYVPLKNISSLEEIYSEVKDRIKNNRFSEHDLKIEIIKYALLMNKYSGNIEGIPFLI